MSRCRLFALAGLALPTLGLVLALAATPDARVLEAEAKRVATIEKIKPSVVAIFAEGSQGGGSGELISPEGYALSNWHVVAGSGPAMKCGLPDGILYDCVLVGLDKVGDVALVKLLPRQEGQKFPYATLGDSDRVHVGDWTLALGNPFLLATDFAPTVTYGLVSGVHRYQYPESGRGLLEYTDCIQVDTSINPGNSGGPLFNMDGELVGINGRISLQKRSRLNSGVGYAISINQIKNFLGHLRAGIDTDHASTGFTVESESEDVSTPRMLIRNILEDSDAARRGLELNDELVSFAGRPITTVNQYKNVLGLFPKGWRVPLVYRRNNEKHEVLVRLMGVQRQTSDDEQPMRPRRPRPRRPDEPEPEPEMPGRPKPPGEDSPALKLYEAKAGYANYYFNRLERDRLLTAARKRGDFATVGGDWTIDGEMEVRQGRADATVTIRDEKDASGKVTRTTARLILGGLRYELDPVKPGQDAQSLKEPPGSGGLLMALYHYRRLLTLGEKGFEGTFAHGGHEPFYVLPADGTRPRSYQDVRVDAEVLQTEHAAIPAKWYFARTDQALLGAEVKVEPSDDPCELYLSDYRAVEGRMLPHRLEVRYGNGRYGVLTVKRYQLAATK